MTSEKTALVLGCGRVGGPMARDLARSHGIRVVAADTRAEQLKPLANIKGITPREADVSAPEVIQSLAQEADVVVGALPSRLGLAALRAVIQTGKPYCDISFMAEDASELDELARVRGTTAVVDCGVAPGLANMLIGYCDSQLDETYNATYYVGGLPRVRHWPFEYKAPFAPLDVIEEYTRPARMIEHGHIVEKPALSDIELINFEEVGTLEAFNTDGLRSMLRTVQAHTMKEKTLRYPGHAQLMTILRETGFFGREPLDINGTPVMPLDVTAKLLFPHWELKPGEEELTLLDVRVSGRKGESERSYHYSLLDRYDPSTQENSMARTTGYPCTAVARMLLDGTFERPGVHPPETLGSEAGLMERIIDELAERNVMVRTHRPV